MPYLPHFGNNKISFLKNKIVISMWLCNPNFSQKSEKRGKKRLTDGLTVGRTELNS